MQREKSYFFLRGIQTREIHYKSACIVWSHAASDKFEGGYQTSTSFLLYLPGILATIAIIMLNNLWQVISGWGS